MTPLAAWGLVAAALAAGWFGFGWRGVVLAVTVIVFWMLLQFSRTLRVMRRAADRPIGQVGSAVMLHSRLRERMTMAQVLALTGSLGERVDPPADGAEESWRWRDAGSDAVTVHVAGGRIRHWTLARANETGAS